MYSSRQLFGFLKDEFSIQMLVSSLVSGFIIGTVTVIVEISFAAMIFSGDLSAFIYNGICFTLFGSFVILIVVALTSSYPSTVARPHEIPAAILAIIAGAIYAKMRGAAPDLILEHIITVIVLSSVLTGLFFLLLGNLKLGSLIRFIPFPVFGGFLAGTGWLLIKGGLSVATDVKPSIANLLRYCDLSAISKWIPALIFAFVVIAVLKRSRHFLVVPSLITCGVLIFYSVLFFTHTSIAEASKSGWLLSKLPDGGMWHPVSFTALAEVNWKLIISQIPNMGTVLLLSVLPLLLNASGLELVVRRDIDFNRELQSAGIANIAAGFGGGTVGLHSLSLSALAHTMGARGRLVGIFAGLVCGGVLFFGSSLLVYFPKPILGGMLMYLGIDFLIEWVFRAWRRMPRVDYILVIVILLVIAVFGFLQGVGVGLLVAVIVFVLNYGRVPVVKHALSGSEYHSNVDRMPSHKQLLHQKGDHLWILRLQGLIFFGTAHNLFNSLQHRAGDQKKNKLSFVILDFSMVCGVDSSAVQSFVKMKQIADKFGFTVIFSRLSPSLRAQFDQSGFSFDGPQVKIFADMDHAMEWCENQIIAQEHGDSAPGKTSLEEHLRKIFADDNDHIRLTKYLEHRDVAKGEYLFRQGETAHGISFIESGRVTVQLESPDEMPLRLRSMGAGTVVGEVGYYLNSPATASVIAEEPSMIYWLSPEALEKMEKEDPEAASAFHKYIIRLLGERLSYTNTLIKALID